MNELSLTVRDVLARDSFKHARVAAGNNGLDRQVKWSHVLEVRDFGSLINGGELILTTGIELPRDLPTHIHYIKKLIETDVACICIEKGIHYQEVPKEIIELADQQNFPIIVFEKTVKFVDITQDLHTLLINHHYEMLSKIDTLSRRFNQLSLMPNGTLKILQELHSFFKQNVLFIADNAKSYYYPVEAINWEHPIQELLTKTSTRSAKQDVFLVGTSLFAISPVNGLGQTLGYVCLQLKQSISNEFTFLILDRASLAIAQISLRDRTIEERKQHNEDELVRNLLHGRPVEQEEVQYHLPTNSRNLHYRIFVIQLNTHESILDEHSWEEIRLQQSMAVRSLFKRNGFFPALTVNKNEISIIASFIAADPSAKDTDRFSQIAQQITDLNDDNFFHGRSYTLGISFVHHDFTLIEKGYAEAKKVLAIKETLPFKSNFYEDLGIYRLLLSIKNQGYLDHYIEDYLHAIIEYDKKTDSNLLETLRIYLECGGSKKETADRLFIVRQTLYHRLNKIESILGKDFMSPLNRVALEVAIIANQLRTIT